MARTQNPINVDSHIRQIVDAAAREIVLAVQRNIVGEVTRLVGSGPARSAAPAPKAAGKPGPAKGAKGNGRRTRGSGPDAAVLDRLLAVIKAKPGMRTEQIRAEIGMSPDVVKPALAKLRETKRVRTKGERRATTYSVA